ncbi:50S ribosomal protein L24e [Candidatus Woesearchaeota archaeon]|nr:50S ribosomal protein L24e [Candidatus Woesearchaeota archaeon]
MARCSFCGYVLEPGTGTVLVKNDGRIFTFCSMKCEKNLLKLGREPRYVKWTKVARKDKNA